MKRERFRLRIKKILKKMKIRRLKIQKKMKSPLNS